MIAQPSVLQPALSQATAVYRLQLRGEMGFREVEGFLPYLNDLQVSHLYLSPIFTARTGSMHGYDVIRPNEIDPCLGGREAFCSLARAAVAAGIGIILDIVPNHTAFSLENPWLRDVLRHGASSPFARHFDIDFSKPLLLPFLQAAFATVAERAKARVLEGPKGPTLEIEGLSIPIARGTGTVGPLSPSALLKLHDRQHWRLAYWELERDLITHRRFFNVTQLIGMRVEDPEVFQDMHSTIFDLVDSSLVQGLRVDHIDGLADPHTYLDRLTRRLPNCPIWVEKILTGDEQVPRDWPVVGTTGYEAGVRITGVLADPRGVERLTRMWQEETGESLGFHQHLIAAKREVMRRDLSAELLQLVDMATLLTETTPEIETGPEAVREAILALLVEMPRYRTYFAPDRAGPDDRSLWADAVERAAKSLRSDRLVRLFGEAISDRRDEISRRFRTRFQQVTGALIAKSHEDTALFRYVPYLAANEVGSDPDEPVFDLQAFESFCQDRLHDRPASLTLTTSHDTKRAEDARMRLVAIGHLPDDFIALWSGAKALPTFREISASVAWYAVQSTVAIWDTDRPEVSDRLAAHMEKALREAKQVTSWTHPVPEAEDLAQEFARELLASWRVTLPASLTRIVSRADTLSLCQLALKLFMPGIPDIYRGTERSALWLTDPDNRQHISLEDLTSAIDTDALGFRKEQCVRQMLQLRANNPQLFLFGGVTVTKTPDGFMISRSHGPVEMHLRLRPTETLNTAIQVVGNDPTLPSFEG